jgi:hypothetical protein
MSRRGGRRSPRVRKAMRGTNGGSALGEGDQRRDGSETEGGNEELAAWNFTRVMRGDANPDIEVS